jgi:putative Mg2+ transporter-C (MgtC) family protein
VNLLADLVQSLGAEFTDLSASQAAVLGLRLLIAGLLGAALGGQRESIGKAAGLRTHILVAVGSAGFVAVPGQAGLGPDALGRIVQGLLAGIGFLGAGCILKSQKEEQIYGLTTAAGLWLTAAVGAAAGMGREVSAVLIGLFGWFTLSVVGRWEQKGKGHPTPPHG